MKRIWAEAVMWAVAIAATVLMILHQYNGQGYEDVKVGEVNYTDVAFCMNERYDPYEGFEAQGKAIRFCVMVEPHSR